MKNAIEYFYNFPSITIHDHKDKITFNVGNKIYHLLPNTRNYNELEEIYNLTREYNNYYKIIKNKNNTIVTNINGKEYILIEVKNDYKEKITLRDLSYSPIVQIFNYQSLKRDNWSELIQKKIDFFIYQREHIRKKYLIIDESLDYYIGMTENAISYLNSTIQTTKNSQNRNITVCHKRISKDEKNSLYNPLNLIIDHKARDISGYLKLIFQNNEEKEKIALIKKILLSLNFNEYDYRLLISRMLYPSFYFDKYEEIVNITHNEKEIIPITKRIKDYELYLKQIFEIISIKIKIPIIEWIFK